MVCVPCFIIPVLLYIWHKFIQPIMLRYWNPWQKKDANGDAIQNAPEFPFACKDGVCPYVPMSKVAGDGASATAIVETTDAPATAIVDNEGKKEQ